MNKIVIFFLGLVAVCRAEAIEGPFPVAKIEVYYNHEMEKRSGPKEEGFKNREKWDEEHGVHTTGGSIESTLYPKPKPLIEDGMPYQGVFSDPVAPNDSESIFDRNQKSGE